MKKLRMNDNDVKTEVELGQEISIGSIVRRSDNIGSTGFYKYQYYILAIIGPDIYNFISLQDGCRWTKNFSSAELEDVMRRGNFKILNGIVQIFPRCDEKNI